VEPHLRWCVVADYQPVTTATFGVSELGNSLRYLTNVPIDNAVWSPDGKSVAYSTWNGEIYRARSDWSEVQKLTSAAGHDKPAFFLAWAPDGETLRFTRGYQLWEISSHGSNPRKLLPDWNPFIPK
jgi:Tol biopolymer transport system component